MPHISVDDSRHRTKRDITLVVQSAKNLRTALSAQTAGTKAGPAHAAQPHCVPAHLAGAPRVLTLARRRLLRATPLTLHTVSPYLATLQHTCDTHFSVRTAHGVTAAHGVSQALAHSPLAQQSARCAPMATAHIALQALLLPSAVQFRSCYPAIQLTQSVTSVTPPYLVDQVTLPVLKHRSTVVCTARRTELG